MVILDHLSGGRLEVGFGRGTLPHEHIMYGIAPRTDRARLLEGLDVILKLWTSGTSPLHHMGEYYSYHGVEMPWAPLQKPHPPVWVPSATRESSLQWAARDFGTGGFGLLPLEVTERAMAAYREGRDQAGLPASGQRVNYMVSTLVADSDEEARALAVDNFGHQMSLFQSEAATTHRMLGRANVTGSAADPYPRLAREAAEGGARFNLIYGSPDTVIERLRELRERLGMTLFLGEFSFGHLPFDAVSRSLTLFSDEVIPKLSGS
jgi:alkanesulfonate monooxygenase SsuD/methylene tetrahydromethanopterin reductase-like flavin-dependent oxidoreductase (luciferase family)